MSAPPPTVAAPHPELVSEGIAPARPGWIARATSADHKSVALLYLGTSLVFAVLALAGWVLMRVQLIVPDNTMVEPELFNRLLSVQGVTTLFLFLVPLGLAFAGSIVPLQIGARGVAFPRLNLLSYWLFALGGVTIYASFAYTPSEAGFAALPPLSGDAHSPSHGVDAWVAGLFVVILGLVLFAINLLATIHNMRAPGMAWRRIPIYSWAATVSSYVLLIVGPLMMAALVMLTVDRHFDGVFFDPGEDGAPLLYQHLSWIFFTGGYAVVLLLAAGAISEIVPTFARKPLFSRGAVMASLAAIGVLAPLAWMQNMFTAAIPEGFAYFAMLCAVGLIVPVGLLLFNWIATLWGSGAPLRAPVLFAGAAISTMTIGLVGELGYAVIPIGWQLSNTTIAQADTIYVLVGAGVMGGFAALHYWFPKLCGRTMSEGLGRASLIAMLVGVHLHAVGMTLAGFDGQPVDIYRFFESDDHGLYNALASVGAFVLAAGVIADLVNVARSYSSGPLASPDPWGGSTLEWFALSPPPPHNFDAVPDVRSDQPLRDIREAVARDRR